MRRGGYRHTSRRAWSTVFGSLPKRFSLMLDLGSDAGVMVDCMTWVASEILGSTCRAKQAGCSCKQFARSRGRGNVRGLTEDAGGVRADVKMCTR